MWKRRHGLARALSGEPLFTRSWNDLFTTSSTFFTAPAPGYGPKYSAPSSLRVRVNSSLGYGSRVSFRNGYDLSSLSWTLKRGLWRLIRSASSTSASVSLLVTMKSSRRAVAVIQRDLPQPWLEK